MYKGNCDETKWDSRLISKYNVTLVLTVDSKGCGNFTKVQEAVNAVPDSSSHATLIILNSGTYRLSSLNVFMVTYFLVFD